MSLILDALKRAERERKLGQAPAALEEVAVPPSTPALQPERKRLALAAAAVFVVALAVLAYVRREVPAAVDAASVPAAAPPAPASAVPAAVPAASVDSSDLNLAKIEDGDAISSFDDLTGPVAAEAAATQDEGSTEVRSAAEPASARAPVEAAATLVTPDSLKAAKAGNARPAIAAPAKPGPAPAPTTTRTVKLQPKPPAAAARTLPPEPEEEIIVEVPPPEVVPSTMPRIPPTGPAVRFAADGNLLEVVEPPPRPAPPPPPPPRPVTIFELPAKPAVEAVAAGSASEAPAPATAEPESPAQLPPGSDAALAAPAATPPAPVAAAAPLPRRKPTPPPATTPAAPNPYAAVKNLKEMPAGYRAEFPAITVDVHAYNGSPLRRFVLINGRRYREGDTLTEGPRIAQIVPNGIVFDWRNEQVLYGGH
jgi:general secretion pathway protein B